jgi:hypothetical protein
LNKALLTLKEFWPSDFNRKPRSLSDLERWKATELRQFLLYIAIVVFKTLLPQSLYHNFLLYYVGITILSRKDLLNQHRETANLYLRAFVQDSSKLYGKPFLSSNVHSLIHLADECKTYGTLDDFSAFAFENLLGELKRMLKKKNQPLEQVANRTHEQITMGAASLENGDTTKSKDLEFNGLKIKVNGKDNHVMLISGEIVKICRSFQVPNGTTKFVGKKYRYHGDLFSYPTPSLLLGVGVYNKNPTENEIFFPFTSIKSKCVLVPFNNKIVFIPLI